MVISLLSLSDALVLLFQNVRTLLSELRIDCPAEFDVGLDLLHCEIWGESVVHESVHVNNVLCDMEIFIIILFIKNDEEDIKSGHNWRGNINIEP